MTPRRRNRTRARRHDSRDGRPPSPPPSRLSSTGSGGWTRLPPAASSPSSKDTTTEQRTYADATARPPGPSPSSTGAPPVTQLSSLRGILSLRPHTSLCPLTFENWTHAWDDGDNKAGGTEETKDDALSVEGSIENTPDDAPAVEDATALADTTTTHRDDDATLNGSATLLSSPASNADSLAGNKPPPSDDATLDSGASIQYTAAPTPPRTPQLDDLPATAPNGMATLQRAISNTSRNLTANGSGLVKSMMPSTIYS
jgi:hypothetical protein